MSKVVYWMTASLDGFVETRDGSIDFTAPDAELLRKVVDDAGRLSASLYGRRTYENMSSYWPTADQDPAAPQAIVDFARSWRRTPKVVWSTTLKHVEHNSRLAGPDLRTEIANLKEEFTGELGVAGASFASSLMKLDLIDEYRIYLRPLILGGGKPYFTQLDRALSLKLVETRTFAGSGGVVLLRYERA